MDVYIIIMYLISNVIFMFAIKNFMDVFFEKTKTSLLVLTFSYLLYFIAASIERLLFNTAETHLIFVLPVLFIISLNYESPMLKRIFAILSSYVIFSIAVEITTVFAFFPHTSQFTFINDILIGHYLLGSLLSLLIALFLKRFKNIRKNNISKPLFLMSAIMVPVASILITIISLLNIQLVSGFLFIVFLAGVNLLILYIYDSLSAAYENKLKFELHQKEKEYYLSQSKLMQESFEKMKAYRHDIKLHLATLKDYTIDNQAATDYLNALIGDITESEIYSETGNIAFDSIINFKLKSAKEDNIKLDITTSIPSVLNIEVIDIVTILGNLLDNALDSVANMEEKIIKLNIKFDKGNLFIKIDNTFDGKIKYEENQDDKKLITTQKDSDEHGHGLKNIKKSAEKYNGHVDISHTDNIFTVGLILYIEDI